MVCKTFFVTGAEGVGKSSILQILKENFPYIDIHDFDKVGVPINPPLSWRLETTKHWLDVALLNTKKNISTCIVGLSFPNEITAFKESKRLDIEFFLLDVSIEERARRLINYGASVDVVEDLECYKILKEHFTENIIDTTNLSIEEVAKQLSSLIRNFFL